MRVARLNDLPARHRQRAKEQMDRPAPKREAAGDPVVKRAPAGKVDYGRMLAQQIVAAGLPEPVLEWTFDAQLDGSGRSWRFDLAWPGWLALDIGKLAVEVDGGVHKLTKRFNADIPKHQAAFALGYKLLRVSPEQVKSGEALEFIRRALT